MIHSFTIMQELFERDMISRTELEFIRFLVKLGEESEQVLLAGAAAIYYHINGHICLLLDDLVHYQREKGFASPEKDELKAILAGSELVGNGSILTPLVLDDDRIYLHKFFVYEMELAQWLRKRSSSISSLKPESKHYIDSLFGDDVPAQDPQKIAVKLSHLKDLIVISGGPGTGKTFTVKKIIESHLYSNPDLKVALATPTGKAAQRLNESLGEELIRVLGDQAVTIHSLLGAKGVSGEFTYNRDNPLPNDLVVVDEASMLDISLWMALIRAIPEEARLILLGDKNQLVSVEAGSILGDICSGSSDSFSAQIQDQLDIELQRVGTAGINDCIVELRKSRRFDEHSGIKKVADAIIEEEPDTVLNILEDSSYSDVRFMDITSESLGVLLNDYALKPMLRMKEYGFDHAGFNRNQILCALRKGPYGVGQINRSAEQMIKQSLGIARGREWYEGRPVMITRNNRTLKIRNGETGFAMPLGDGGYEVILDGREQGLLTSRVSDYELSYGITVHKSQGSEYQNVALLLSNSVNALLSKELLYTSVTRARQNLLVIGNRQLFSSIVTRGILRRSGLQNRIWDQG